MGLDDIDVTSNTINVTDEDGSNEREASFIDFDTMKDVRGQKYRLSDINAGEVAGDFLGILSMGEVGSSELTEQGAILANHYGFSRIKHKGSDSYDRGVIDLVNEQGQNLSDFGIEERLVGANRNTSQEVLTNRMLNRFVDSLGEVMSPASVADRSRGIINAAIKDADVAPIWAKNAVNEEQFALAKRMFSHEELAALSEAYKVETDPAKKQRIQNALYEAKNNSNPFISVENRQRGRSIDNQSYSQFTTSLELGLENTAEAMYGIADMVGQKTGWEWLEEEGEAGISRSKQDAALLPETLTSYNQIKDTGDAFRWVTNNVAMSLPFMGAVVAGSVVTGGLGGAATLGTAGSMVVGSLPSAILTTGGIWNSMPEGEKSASIAVAGGFAVGLLDRFGFTGMPKAVTNAAAVKSGSMKDLFKSIQEEVAQALVKKEGNTFTIEQARKKVVLASRAQLLLMADQFGKQASKQLRDLKLVKDTVRQIARATTREAATETIQTAIEEVAAVTGNSAELDPATFKEALITSAVIGGVFGSTFAMPSVAKQYSDRRTILAQLENSTKAESQLDEMARDDQAEALGSGKIDRSNDDNLADIDSLKEADEEYFNNRVLSGRAKRSETSTASRLAKAFAKRPSGAFVPHLVNMINKIGFYKENGDRRILLSRLGSVLGELNINSGPSHQQYTQLLRGDLTSILPDPSYVAQKLGTNVRNANTLIRRAMEDIDNGVRYTGPKAVEVNAIIEGYRESQANLKEKLFELGLNEEATKLKDGGLEILNLRQLDQRRIQNDRDGFLTQLEGMGMSPTHAKATLDSLLSANSSEAAEAFNNNYSKEIADGRLRDYMTNDILGAYRAGFGSIAKRVSDEKYLGQGQSKLNKVFKAMVDTKEITEAEADELAADIQDYLEIANGDYGKWESPWIKSVQDNLILLTFLRGMGFSAIASFPEVPLTQLGVPQDIAFRYMRDHAKEGAKNLAEYLNHMASAAPGSPIPRKVFSKSDREKGGSIREQLTKLGYGGSEGSAVKQYGIEVGKWQQKIAEHYAKAVGLTNITDYTRGIRAGMAADVINHYASILALDPTATTKMGREAYTELRELGVNVEFMTRLHTRWAKGGDVDSKGTGSFESEAEEKQFRDNLDIGTLNFVDQAIVNPLPGRVPKGYKHQKLAFFNQFQGFIAHFQSKILPKLYGKITNGAPGAASNAVTVALTMTMAAMLGTMLRDEIKYGETTPYLDDWDKFRRVMFSTGLLGTGERLWTGIDPLYGSPSLLPTSGNSIGASLSRTAEGVLGEAAAYGTVKDVANSVYELGFGDNRKATKSALKLVPVFGSVNQARDNILDRIHGKEL